MGFRTPPPLPSPLAAGAVGLAGDAAVYQTLKIGYDTNSDDDIDDAGDDVAISEAFSGTSFSPTYPYDHTGNMIDDGRFVYVYDAWNRLVKVRSANDADGERSEREQSATGKADTEVRGRTATCPEGASTKRATGGSSSPPSMTARAGGCRRW